MPRTVPTAFSSCAGMDIGLVVDLADDGNAPYAFTGTVKQLVFDLKPTTYDDEKTLLGLSASAVLNAGRTPDRSRVGSRSLAHAPAAQRSLGAAWPRTGVRAPIVRLVA